MTTPQTELPVNVLAYPHWRVNFRPENYSEEAIPTLSECFQIVEKNRVRLRGWDFPHLSNRDEERGHGAKWVASWSSFMSHLEYWRFYQSTQFLHLSSVREATEERWREKLQQQTAVHLSHIGHINWDEVPGFISIMNFIFCATEIIEFAARLCQAEVYKGEVNISIQLNKIKGFVLTTDWNRAWSAYYAANEDSLGKTWAIDSGALIANSAQYSLDVVVWFFERFGWLNPSTEVLRKDIDDYLKGKR
ncbi:MAG TPA: hypothetical protein PLA74_03025 [Syntrophales bacterium]|nr:hypothetical protein [Syntrophales bacterium]HPQ43996.1 hypothetical protein [Syntrophales bacterium]